MEQLDRDVHDIHHSLASVFVKLDTPYKQREALNGLFEKFSHSQIRESTSLLSSTDFTYDIVSNLPLEINVMIFQHLQIYQVFQARRVSSKWLRHLSSPVLVDRLLQHWDSMGKTPLKIPEGLEAQIIRSHQAEHIDAYRRGLAFSMVAYPWESQPCLNHHSSVCADGRLAWIDETRKVLYVLNLERGTKQSFTPQNRDTLTAIAVSMYIVAAVSSSGKCYVWELHSGHAHSFRLFRYGTDLYAWRTTLAIFHRSDKSSEEYVTTWNLDSLHSFVFSATARLDVVHNDEWREKDGKKVLLSGQSVIIFEQLHNDENKVHFKRLSLNGFVQASGSLDVHATVNYDKTYAYEYPQSSERFSTVWTYIPFYETQTSQNRPSKAGHDDLPYLLCLLYDLEQNCLRLERHSPRIHQNIFQDERLCRSHRYKHENGCLRDFFFDKDVAYCRVQRTDGAWLKGGLKVIDLTHDECSLADMDRYTSKNFERFNCYMQKRGIDVCQAFQPHLLGDGIYLIEVTSGGFVAWCFDKHITMANEDKGYRLFRDKLIKENIKKRRERIEPPHPSD